MHASAGDLAADHRRGHDFALAFFKQQNRHAFAHAFTRHVAEDARTFGVQGQVHGGFLRLGIKAGLRVRQVLAGENHLLFDDHGLPAAFQKTLRAKRHSACAVFGRARFQGLIDHAHFQCGRAAQNVLGLGGVLHARQLHHDAVLALLLDDGLGHAQLVDAVVQGGDVLLERLVLHAAGRHRLDGGGQLEIGAVGRVRRFQVGELVLDEPFRGVQGGRVAKADFDLLAISADAAVAHVFLAQAGADVARQGLGLFGQRRLHVHLEHEVHAAAQVQAQVHGHCAQAGKPCRRLAEQIERDHVTGVGTVRHQRLLDRVLGLELHL